MLPLLFSQLIMVFIWSCLGCLQVGYFRHQISGQEQVEGNAFRYFAIRTFLSAALLIEPLTVFFYTWYFLPTLEVEEDSETLSLMY